jgi:hypothetical protein
MFRGQIPLAAPSGSMLASETGGSSAASVSVSKTIAAALLMPFPALPGARRRSPRARNFRVGSAQHSVGAGIRPSVWRVIRAANAVVVIAVTETMSSIAIAIVASAITILTSAIARAIVTSAEATHVTSAETAHVTSAETTAAAEAAPVSSASAAAPSSTTTAATCLCTRRKQSPGKKGACQYHHRSSYHRSSSHHIFLSTGGAISDQ